MEDEIKVYEGMGTYLPQLGKYLIENGFEIEIITMNPYLFDKAIFNFHFNIITGIDEKHIYVNDPMWDYRGGEQKYEINDFMYAIYASTYGDLDNASIMKIKKKEKYLKK